MSTIAATQTQDHTQDVTVLDTLLPGDVRYYCGQNILLSLGQQLEAYDADRVLIVTQRLLWEPHGRHLYAALKERYLCGYAFVPDGESAKSFSTLASLCEELVELGATRDTVLVALGGGVVGNITGLAAALLYRGIRFVEVPTTTTALTDSVLSNKQAVNGRSGKNHFGVYYAPLFIWGDTRTAMSEPARVRTAGIVESVKNGLVGGYPILNAVERYYQSNGPPPYSAYHNLVLHSIHSKLDILKKDPSESGYAVVLEYGHTIGHALEYLSGGRLLHGEAVAIGMCVEAEISNVLGYLRREECDCHRAILHDVMGLDVRIPASMSVDAIVAATAADNKRGRRGTQYVLLSSIGQVLSSMGDYTVAVPPAAVRTALARVSRKGAS